MKFHFTNDVENIFDNGAITRLGMDIEVKFVKVKSRDYPDFIQIKKGWKDVGNNWSERIYGVCYVKEESINAELKAAEEANDSDRAEKYIDYLVENYKI